MNSVLLFQGLPSPEFVRAQMERLCGAKYPGQVDAPPDATLKRRAALAKKRKQAAYQMDYRNRKKTQP